MLINFHILKGQDNNTSISKTNKGKEERIRVTERTATGGWY